MWVCLVIRGPSNQWFSHCLWLGLGSATSFQFPPTTRTLPLAETRVLLLTPPSRHPVRLPVPLHPRVIASAETTSLGSLPAGQSLPVCFLNAGLIMSPPCSETSGSSPLPFQ